MLRNKRLKRTFDSIINMLYIFVLKDYLDMRHLLGLSLHNLRKDTRLHRKVLSWLYLHTNTWLHWGFFKWWKTLIQLLLSKKGNSFAHTSKKSKVFLVCSTARSCVLRESEPNYPFNLGSASRQKLALLSGRFALWVVS